MKNKDFDFSLRKYIQTLTFKMKKKQNQASKLDIVQEEQMTPLMHHINTIRVGYVDQKKDFKITWLNASKKPTLAFIFIPQSLIGLEPSYSS